MGADLEVRLLWLTLFRTVATALVLGGLAVQLGSRSRAQEPSVGELASFAVIGVVFFSSLATGLVLRWGRVGRWAAWSQVVFDILLAGSVAFLTGGPQSPFSFLFLVAIVGAAVLLGWRGAVAGGAGAMLTYGGVLAGLLATGQLPLSSPRLLWDVGGQLLAQALIAILAGYVGEQLSRAGGRLSASQQDLRQLTALQNEIVRAMPSGLVTSDASGRVTFVNPAARALLGREQEALDDVSLEALLPGLSTLARARRSELTVHTARGERTLGLSVTPLAADDSRLVVFQDLTELRRVEQELRRIDHLASLGRLSAQLAHEVRNPLAAMRGSAQLLAGDLAGTPQERLARLILREADRLAELVDGYLRLARPPPPSMTTVSLPAVVTETLELLRADSAFASISVETALEQVEAHADAGQLTQVLLNLLRNAAAAVRPSRGHLRVRVTAEQGRPRLEVWDSAGAIRSEDQARLFEPFFTRTVGGSGLGLSTVQAIVLAHGGTITVTSTPETGTTFSVTLQPPEGRTHGPRAGGG